MKHLKPIALAAALLALCTVPAFADLAPPPLLDSVQTVAVISVAVVIIIAIVLIRHFIKKKRYRQDEEDKH